MKKNINRILILWAIFCVLCSTSYQIASGTEDANKTYDADSKSRDATSLSNPTSGERMAHLNNLGYLKEALTSFYVDNDRFPHDAREFLEWGVPLWPMNPLTGKPVMLKSEIDEFNSADSNDISYKFENENKAQFTTMIYNPNTMQWARSDWPGERYLEMVVTKNPGCRKLLDTRSDSSRFTSGFITMATGVFFHTKFNRMPVTLKEMSDYGFKVVLDNWHPVTDSRDENMPGYFEIGIDRDKHYIYQIWTAAKGEVRKVAYPYPDGAAGNLMAFADKSLSDDAVDKLNKEVLIASWMTSDEIKARGGGIIINEILNPK